MAWRHLLVELQRAFHRKRFEDRQRNERLDLLVAPGRYALRVGDDYSIDPACPM
jgi:hypothetical protein